MNGHIGDHLLRKYHLYLLIPFCLFVFCSIFFTKQRWFYARRTDSFSYITQHQDDFNKIAVTPKDKKTLVIFAHDKPYTDVADNGPLQIEYYFLENDNIDTIQIGEKSYRMDTNELKEKIIKKIMDYEYVYIYYLENDFFDDYKTAINEVPTNELIEVRELLK